MKSPRAKQVIQAALEKMGVQVNGSRPFDIQIHDERFYHRVLSEQSVGLGEAYMDGWWDCDRLDIFFERLFQVGLNREQLNWRLVLARIEATLVNLQSKKRSLNVIREHYDLGNDLYQPMLGPSMVYTCGYWENTNDLDRAQFQKMELVCRKLQLQPGMRILDIGSGFGSFLIHAAKYYGVQGVGVTLSQKQREFAIEACRGLPIEIRLQDYRDVSEKFDRVISIGMFEAVGPKNFATYMEKCSSVLKDDGAFLLHTMGANKPNIPTSHWVDKYIFPGGHIPAVSEISKAFEGHFRCDDLQNFGPDYDRTLCAWHERYLATRKEIPMAAHERFHRMWEFYLLSFAGAFRAKHFQLWQFVLSKPHAPQRYLSEARVLK
jgi:cyclopropane-fatty-acyl-phospholipid synthase